MFHNPKLKGTNNSRCGIMELDCDPIGDEIRDPENTKLFYQNFPIIPFLDDSDTTLFFLRKMAEQSVTHGSCIDTISDYAIGGEFDVVNKSIAGVFNTKLDVQTVPKAILYQYIEFIEKLSPSYGASSMLEIAEAAYQNLQIYGNIFMRVDLLAINGKKYVNFKIIDCENIRYISKPKSPKQEFIIAPNFTKYNITSNNFEIIPRWPYSSTQGNTISTIIHFKNQKVMRKFYGLPRSIQSIRFQYLEFQNAQWINEGFASDFTLRAFFEFVSNSASTNSEIFNSDQEFIDAMKQFYRRDAGSRQRRILYRTKSNGEDGTSVKEFRRNLEYSFNDYVSREAQHQIIKSHNWHPVLIGTATSGKLGQTKEIPELTKLKGKTTVKKIQNAINNVINQGLDIAAEFVGNDISKSYSLALREVFDDIFPSDSIKGIKEFNPNNQ